MTLESAGTMNATSVAYVLASIAMVLIAAGLFFASDRRRHVPLMLLAFGLDMTGLVLVEFSRHAVEKVAKGGVSAMTYFHTAVAVLAVVGYFVQIVTGRRLMRAERGVLGVHKKWAKIFLISRLAAYVTMWFV